MIRDAERAVAAAESYAVQHVAEARGRARAFSQLLDEYRRSPVVVRHRLSPVGQTGGQQRQETRGLMVVYGHRILQAMADPLERLATSTGFQWDAANADKNWERHRVSRGECEQVFLGRPSVVAIDEKHSQEESRYYALGRTGAGRFLFITFTIRGPMIRVISARDMSRAERRRYEQAQVKSEESNPTIRDRG